jgi:hypothetical protein
VQLSGKRFQVCGLKLLSFTSVIINAEYLIISGEEVVHLNLSIK